MLLKLPVFAPQTVCTLDPGKAKAAVKTTTTTNNNSNNNKQKQWKHIWCFLTQEATADLRSGRIYKLLPILFEKNLPSQPLYTPGLTHHGYTPKPSGARVLYQCQSIYILKNTLKMPALPQLGLLLLCPAVRVVNISNIHDVWTSSKWHPHTHSPEKFQCLPTCCSSVEKRWKILSPEIKESWKQTVPTAYLG